MEIKTLMNGTALLTANAVAKQIPQGWKVKCTNGKKPWRSIRHGAHENEMTNVIFAATKKEAIKYLADAE